MDEVIHLLTIGLLKIGWSDADSYYNHMYDQSFYSDGSRYGGGLNPSGSAYIRPCFLLRDDIVIVSGDGTKDNPYVLGKKVFEDVPLEEATITFGNVSWRNEVANVKISTNAKYTIEYQVNSYTGNWTKAILAGEDVRVSNLKHNDVVYARLRKGTNTGNYATLKIADITDPKDATITLSGTTVEVGTSIMATVNHTDNQSGIDISNCKWVLNTNSSYIGTNSSYYTGGTFNNNNETITINASTEGNYYLHVLSVDKAGNKRETISDCVLVNPATLRVGTVVTYEPTGTYEWLDEYSSYSTRDEDVILDSSTDGYKITSWRVLETDENTEKVKLVPIAATTDKVKLSSWQGYNNGVFLLNEACKNLYGNSDKGIEARSINIEDIEDKMTDTALNEAYSGNIYVGDQWNYGIQSTVTYTNRYYPIIYPKERLSVIDGIKNTTGLGLSEQTYLIGETDEGAVFGQLKAESSIKPYRTSWTLDAGEIEKAFVSFENGYGNYYDLLFPDGRKTNYCIASRAVHPHRDTLVSFGMYAAEAIYGITFQPLCHSGATMSYNYEYGLFPIVTVDSDMIEWTLENGFKVSVD